MSDSFRQFQTVLDSMKRFRQIFKNPLLIQRIFLIYSEICLKEMR